MTNLILSALLILCYGAHLYDGKPTGGKVPEEEIDSYAIVPSKQQQKQDVSLPPNLELSLDMVPPSVLKTSSPHIYFMNSDGIAEPAETGEVPQRRRRDVAAPPSKNNQNHVAPSSSDETMKTDETIIIGPPSGRSFGYSAVTLGFRPARAHYARRYHKYPWNYH